MIEPNVGSESRLLWQMHVTETNYISQVGARYSEPKFYTPLELSS